jgi:hypothetical protein
MTKIEKKERGCGREGGRENNKYVKGLKKTKIKFIFLKTR